VVQEKQPSRVERLVPAVLIGRTAAEVILLNCTMNEFLALEPFNQTEFVYSDLPHHAKDPSLTLLWPYVVPAKRVVDEKIRPIPPGELAVRRGARVRATDGRVGRVDEFLIDPDSGSITHLCLRKDHIFGDRAVCIPVSEIGTIEETVVHLSIDKEALAALPSVPVQRAW
jgi:sporulation protein YlmC with PRC-barrel domain